MTKCLREVRMERASTESDRIEIRRVARAQRDSTGSTVCLRWPVGNGLTDSVDATRLEVVVRFNAKRNDVVDVFLIKGDDCGAVDVVIARGIAIELWIPLSLQDVGRIGPATERALRNAGIDSVRALAESSEEDLHDILSDSGIRSSATTIINNANEAMGG